MWKINTKNNSYINLLNFFNYSNSYLKLVEELKNKNILLSDEIDKLTDEKINLIDSKIEKQIQLNIKILDQKMSKISSSGIIKAALYFVINFILIVTIPSQFFKLLITISGGCITFYSIKKKFDKIDEEFLIKSQKLKDEFENNEGKRINEKIFNIDKKIESKKNEIIYNDIKIKNSKTKIKLINYYVNQMKYLTDKMCKEDVDAYFQKKYKINQNISFQLKEKVKSFKLN